MSEEMDDTSRSGASDEAHDDLEGVAGLDTRAAGRLVELEAECARLKEQLLRTAADFDNFRKRARRDVDDAAKRGTEDTIRDFLPIIDNLERAAAAAGSASDVQAVASGVQMVLKLFDDVGSRWGLTRVEALGTRFDPALHDAVQQVETTDHPPATIMHEVTPGYSLGERLLRPALVVVARAPSAGRQDAAEADAAQAGEAEHGDSSAAEPAEQ